MDFQSQTMNILRPSLLLLVCMIILQSCHKPGDEQIPQGGTRLKMVSILEKAKYTTYFHSFAYDSAARLRSFVDSIWFRTDNKTYTGMSWPINDIEYDQNGKIIQVAERDLAFDKHQLWFYNSENLVSKVVAVHMLSQDTIINFYKYDSNKRLISDSVYNSEKKTLINYTTFGYDANNNAIQWKHFTNTSGTIKNDLTWNVVYDNHPNPYRTVINYAAPNLTGYACVSQNNITRMNCSDGSVQQFQYEYYSNGLPWRSVNTIVSGQTTIQNVNYLYE